ncbi:Venom allergen 3 [Trachymyrmex septentrionalis]|uniref:Venom allergen 3 n=1 Tax=Trachymyrmex septentrionalis TaxID=34720 RepID=A0A195FGP0_9HYME|nr:PREDICTED: venom allergen 3-like [Trachymyrmex septentrionalis]KYN39541.1 Venom allergen 3 [Trachymyrmex septentrionalis]
MAVIFPLYFAVMAGVFINTIATDDYCDVKTCKIKGPHTMCTYTSSKPSATCKQVNKVGVTDEDIDTILTVHNKLRQKVASGKEYRGNPGPQPKAVSMPKLSWNKELANIGQRWANQCIYNHDACRDIDKFQVGQNIAQSYSSKENNSTIQNFIEDVWYDEVKNFDANKVDQPFEMQVETGHYTQIVWATTTEIGCGFIKYKDTAWHRSCMVCNYGPAGNIKNERMYEIAN